MANENTWIARERTCNKRLVRFVFHYFTQNTCIFIDICDISWVFLLKQRLYVRSQKDKQQDIRIVLMHKLEDVYFNASSKLVCTCKLYNHVLVKSISLYSYICMHKSVSYDLMFTIL